MLDAFCSTGKTPGPQTRDFRNRQDSQANSTCLRLGIRVLVLTGAVPTRERSWGGAGKSGRNIAVERKPSLYQYGKLCLANSNNK